MRCECAVNAPGMRREGAGKAWQCEQPLPLAISPPGRLHGIRGTAYFSTNARRAPSLPPDLFVCLSVYSRLDLFFLARFSSLGPPPPPTCGRRAALRRGASVGHAQLH
mmetsp:Transcript_6886/g.22590  ORF Transcript_6886/g.22590 Transcript_6886/m.22590 type:complete len:108 (-) Transcript_6886:701-1024(-)